VDWVGAFLIGVFTTPPWQWIPVLRQWWDDRHASGDTQEGGTK
jgi:hypothetical protein